MTQTPRNHRNIIIASIVVAILLISLVAALIEYNQLTAKEINLSLVTVSGQASSAALYMWGSSLISIQFIDTQTGTNTSYNFNFPPPPTLNPFGNYTVTLLDQHTYNVTISYYGSGPSGSTYMDQFSDYIGNFTVDAPAGQTQVTKNFGVP
jgi:hypothetical protein